MLKYRTLHMNILESGYRRFSSVYVDRATPKAMENVSIEMACLKAYLSVPRIFPRFGENFPAIFVEFSRVFGGIFPQGFQQGGLSSSKWFTFSLAQGV